MFLWFNEKSFMATEETQIAPLDSDILSNVGSQLYETWLKSPYKTVIKSDRTPMPTEILADMARSPLEGGTTLLEVIVAKLVDKAISGDMRAIEKVYDELQHDGVRKMSIESRSEISLAPEVLAVLQQAGYESVIDGDFEEIDAAPAQIEEKPSEGLEIPLNDITYDDDLSFLD